MKQLNSHRCPYCCSIVIFKSLNCVVCKIPLFFPQESESFPTVSIVILWLRKFINICLLVGHVEMEMAIIFLDQKALL